jgi:hypothetical protein
MTEAAKRVALRYAATIRWKRNVAEGKHTRATISKTRSGWQVEVTTNWTSKPQHLDTDGTVYKAEAQERGDELIAEWDRNIERQGREDFE